MAENDDIIEIIVKYNSLPPGIEAESLGHGFGIVRISRDKIPELAGYPGVEDIEPPKRVFINDAFSDSSVCLTAARSENGYGLSGSGAAVCIIDTGIDYTHPAFLNEQGKTRILYFWDQEGEGEPPEFFFSGAEYTSEDIDLALSEDDPFSVVPQLDINGHGTAVAGIAAGREVLDNGLSGAAPFSSIIAVRVGRGQDDFARSTQLMRALRYVIDRARSLGMPAAVNISYGMNQGAHDGDSLFEKYITAVSSEWKTNIIIPVGNEGGAGHHYRGTIDTGQTKDIEFFTAAGISRFYISIWKNFTDIMSASLILPGGRTALTVSPEDPVNTTRIGSINVSAVYSQPAVYSIDQEILFEVDALTGFIPDGLWKLRLKAESVVDGGFDIWLPTVEEVTTGTYFSLPSNENTITIPATASGIIRTAGYNDRIGSAAEFSGIAVTGIQSAYPDLAAPAVSVTSARIGGGYDSFTGTSFAAPFVTGAAALMMEWGIVRGNAPFMYGERLKAYLRLGAKRSDSQSYPNPVMGYGMLCVSSALDSAAQTGIGRSF